MSFLQLTAEKNKGRVFRVLGYVQGTKSQCTQKHIQRTRCLLPVISRAQAPGKPATLSSDKCKRRLNSYKDSTVF